MGFEAYSFMCTIASAHCQRNMDKARVHLCKYPCMHISGPCSANSPWHMMHETPPQNKISHDYDLRHINSLKQNNSPLHNYGQPTQSFIMTIRHPPKSVDINSSIAVKSARSIFSTCNFQLCSTPKTRNSLCINPCDGWLSRVYI